MKVWGLYLSSSEPWPWLLQRTWREGAPLRVAVWISGHPGLIIIQQHRKKERKKERKKDSLLHYIESMKWKKKEKAYVKIVIFYNSFKAPLLTSYSAGEQSESMTFIHPMDVKAFQPEMERERAIEKESLL